MKKRVIFLFLISFITLTYIFTKQNIFGKTIEEVLPSVNSKPVNILHEEKIDRGMIVFYNHLNGNDLSVAILKKKLGSYKVVYSGTQADIKKFLSKFGISYTYMPAIGKVSPPMYLGIVGNPNITQVNIIEKKRNIVRQAKIIDAKGTRIWLIYMNDLEGSYFKIIGLSKDGKELIIRDDNILPWHVEQKPFKGYN